MVQYMSLKVNISKGAKIIIASSIVAAMLCAAMIYDRTIRNYLTDSEGKIVSGSAFHVEIGEEFEHARAIMRKQGFKERSAICIQESKGVLIEKYIPVSQINRGNCEKFYIGFEDPGIFFGGVDFEVVDGSVSQISWRYSALNI